MDAVEVSEEPGQGHWFPTVMNSTAMIQFYTKCLTSGAPPFPDSFVATCFDPSVCGARGSLQLLQLLLPSRCVHLLTVMVTKLFADDAYRQYGSHLCVAGEHVNLEFAHTERSALLYHRGPALRLTAAARYQRESLYLYLYSVSVSHLHAT